MTSPKQAIEHLLRWSGRVFGRSKVKDLHEVCLFVCLWCVCVCVCVCVRAYVHVHVCAYVTVCVHKFYFG